MFRACERRSGALTPLADVRLGLFGCVFASVTMRNSGGDTRAHLRACVLLQICGVWKNLAKPLMRQLQSEQIRISMSTSVTRREEVEGKIIKHRALFAGAHGILCEIHFSEVT